MIEEKRQFPVWGSILSFLGLVVFVVAGLWLWRFEEYRPYIAIALSLAAALIGQFASLIPERLRGKWLFVVATAIIVTGALFAAKSINEALQKVQEENSSLNERLTGLTKTVGNVVKLQSAESQSSFLLLAGRYERNLYAQKQIFAILDLADTLLEIDPENGHGLYYAAEAHRHKRYFWYMRDNFQKYLDAAGRNPDSTTGDRKVCYERSNGYCLERLAWVNHLMALDNLNTASSSNGQAKVDPLRGAFRYLRAELEIWPKGFEGEVHTASSCGILKVISLELKKLGENSQAVDDLMKNHEAACSG